MAPEKKRKSRKVLNARQIVLRDEKRQKIKDNKEKEQNRQLAEPQNQADLPNNPPVIEITPEPQIPVPPVLDVPDISFINQPDQRQNVVRAFVVIKQEGYHKRMAVSGQNPVHDPFNRQSFRPRPMGFKPVIPVVAAPAETVEMTASSDSQGTQAEIRRLDDIPVEAVPAETVEMKASSDSQGNRAKIRRLDDIPVEAAPAETVEMKASSDSQGNRAKIRRLDDIPVEAAPAETVEMTASSDSNRIQAEIVELDDIPVEAPPAKRFKMMDSSDLYGIQAEIVGLDDIQVETAVPAETVEMAASSDSRGIQAETVMDLDDMEVETSNAAPGALVEIEPLNDIIPDDSDFNSFSGYEYNLILLDPDASVTVNLNDLLSTYGLDIDETWSEFDNIELTMDVSSSEKL